MAFNVPEYFNDFVETVSAGQYRPQKKFVGQMLHGIISGGSVPCYNRRMKVIVEDMPERMFSSYLGVGLGTWWSDRSLIVAERRVPEVGDTLMVLETPGHRKAQAVITAVVAMPESDRLGSHVYLIAFEGLALVSKSPRRQDPTPAAPADRP